MQNLTANRRNLMLGLGGLMAISIHLSAVPAHAEDVKLFKVISVKDEITVGVGSRDVGGTPDLGQFADAFKKAGKIELWKYATRKETSGDLVQAPQGRVILIWNDLLRIEPLATPLKVIAP